MTLIGLKTFMKVTELTHNLSVARYCLNIQEIVALRFLNNEKSRIFKFEYSAFFIVSFFYFGEMISRSNLRISPWSTNARTMAHSALA